MYSSWRAELVTNLSRFFICILTPRSAISLKLDSAFPHLGVPDYRMSDAYEFGIKRTTGGSYTKKLILDGDGRKVLETKHFIQKRSFSLVGGSVSLSIMHILHRRSPRN
jgi:hypothetical protein